MPSDHEKTVPFRFRYAYQKILQSCNGLLLLGCRNSAYGYNECFICNPTTRKYRKLLVRGGFSGLGLASDSSKSPYYKVFCFRSSGEHAQWFEVYDSETHTWKDGGDISNIGRRKIKIFNGIYWNGDIHFIRPRGWSFCFCLDLEDNFYDVNSEIPRIRSPGAKKNHIMESNGHMHCVTLCLQSDKNYLCVFEMDEEDWSCFIKHEANLNAIPAKFAGKNGSAICVVGMVRGEREENSLLLLHVPGKIIVCRFCDEIFEVLVDFTTEYYLEEGQLQFEFKDAFPLFNTLAPV